MDGKPDVYFFLHDNQDELGTNDPTLDNDNRVMVGSLCISDTMKPRSRGQEAGSETVTKDYLVVEAMLQQANQAAPCTQAGCGDGANNLN